MINFAKLFLFLFLFFMNLNATENISNIKINNISTTNEYTGDTISNIDVISSLELEEKHYTTLSQAINNIVGVNILNNGGIGQLSSYFIRGLKSSYVKVLINGIPFNDPTTIGQQAQLEHILIADIEKIEIIKGAQTGVYGSGSIAGVINIITKNTTNKLTQNYNFEFGSNNTKKIILSSSQRINDLAFYVGYNKVKSDSFTARSINNNIKNYENDKYVNTTYTINGSLFLKNSNKLGIKYIKTNASIDYDQSIDDQDDYSIDQKNKLSNIYFKHNYSANSYTNIFYNTVEFEKKDLKGFTKIFNGTNKIIGIDNKVNYYNNSFVSFGFDSKESKDLISKNKIKNHGIYLSSNSKYKTIEFLGTIRRDRFKKFTNFNTGKFGFKYNINSYIDFSYNHGISKKMPSLYELFSSYSGNDKLKAYNIKSNDISLSYKNAIFTYFENEINNEILYSNDTFRYYNSNNASFTKGIEIKFNYEMFTDTLFSFNYTSLDAKDADDFLLPKRAEEIMNISFDYYGLKNVHLNLNTNYIGNRIEYDYGTHNISARTGNYTIVNSVINYQWTKNVNLYLKINNITNKYYQEVSGYSTSPRAFYVGVLAKY